MSPSFRISPNIAIAILVAVVGLIASIATTLMPYDLLAVYGFIGLIYFIGMLIAAYRLAQENGPFDPLAWFLLAAGLLFGLGLVTPFVYPGESAEYFTTEYALARDIPKVAILNYLSVLIVVFSCLFGSGSYAGSKNPSMLGGYRMLLDAAASKVAVYLVIGHFLLAGQILSIAMPEEYLLSRFGGFFQACILLLVFALGYGFRTAGAVVKIISFEFMVFAAVVGIATLYKFNALAPLVFFSAGYAIRNKFRLGTASNLILTLFIYIAVIAPVVTAARESNSYRLTGLTLSDRAQSISDALSLPLRTRRETSIGEEILNRFSHVRFQAYLINEYDAGISGNSMDNWHLGLIPRILYPGKPDVTRFGREFNDRYFLRTGEGSSLALTYSAEAYWNGGWVMVCLVSVIFGLEIGVLRRMIRSGWDRREWSVIALSPLAALFAYSAESTFVAHKVGGFVTIAVMLLIAKLASNIPKSRGRE